MCSTVLQCIAIPLSSSSSGKKALVAKCDDEMSVGYGWNSPFAKKCAAFLQMLVAQKLYV